MVPTRGITNKWREPDMEYVQELENLKNEIDKSGKRIEDLSDLMQDFSSINKLQETIKDFQENSNLSRIETKIDIIAQSDSTEIINLLVNELNNDIDEKHNILSSKISSVEELPKAFGQIQNSFKTIPTVDFVAEKFNSISKLIAKTHEKLDDESDKKDFLNILDIISNGIYELKEMFPETTVFNEVKQELSGLSAKVFEVHENLYPIQNLQTLNESLTAAQDKLNIIIENSNVNNIENLQQSLDLDTKFGSLGEQLNILQARTEQIDITVKNETETSEELKKDTEDIKQVLSFINSEIGLIKENVEDPSNKEVLNILNEKISNIDNNLYPLQNLQTVNENFESAQDKLNILVEAITNNSAENIKDVLDLENKFNNVHFQIDKKVVEALSSIKECFNELNGKQNETEEIKNAISFLNHEMKNISENLKYSQKNNLSDEILHSLVNDINLIKESINTGEDLEDINGKILNLDTKILGIQEVSQFKEDIGFIKENICQLKEKFNYSNEQISEFSNFTDNNSNEHVGYITDQLKSVNETLNYKIEQNAQTLNNFLVQFTDKLENLNGQEDTTSIKEDLYNLSESVNTMSESFSDLCNEFSSLKRIKKKTENINDEIEFASSNQELSEINDKIEFLIEEIKTYKENLAPIPSGGVNNDLIENAIERVEQALKGTKPEFEEIRSSSNNLSEKLEDLSSDFSDQSEKTLNKLDEFLSLGQDLGSKINQNSLNAEEILNLLSQTNLTNETSSTIKEDLYNLIGEINGFDNDITDISSKINKLILNSNENTSSLSDNFQNSIDILKEDIKRNLQTNSSTVDKTNKNLISGLSKELNEIYQKIENVNSQTVNGVKTSGIIKEAIIQMAEWIDSAGNLLEENNDNIKQNLAATNTTIESISDAKTNIVEQIDKVTSKFEMFEIRLESIEAKLEKLDENKKEDEIKKLLNEIMEKIPEPNSRDKNQELVLNKIDKLETQMVLVETKIEKIADTTEEKKPTRRSKKSVK